MFAVVNGTNYITLVGATAGSVLTERFNADTGLRDTTYGPLKGAGPDHQSWSLGPSGTAYAATLDTVVNQVVISGSGGTNDFLVARFNNNDGTLDTTFGSGGSIKIDFGTTLGVTTDGARSIMMRLNSDSSVDILVAGYTLVGGKYKIALVDLLDNHTFEVT